MFRTDYGEYDPNSWEDLCQRIFKNAYKDEIYQKMPDANGDLGIEGFTLKTGKLFQCYCPEDNIKGQELYSALRGKITKDIKKLERNAKELRSILGDVKIREWYLVTPRSADKNIYKHCRKKEKEIAQKNLDILDTSFQIIIHEIEDYITYLNFSEDGIRFDADVDSQEKEVWENGQNEYVNNAKKKYTVVFQDDYSDITKLEKSVLKAVDISITRYLRGKKQLDFLRVYHPKDYEKFERMVSRLEEDVIFESLGAITDKKSFIKELIETVEKKAKTYLKGYDIIMIGDLANQVVARWILECSLNFV